jgi:transposase
MDQQSERNLLSERRSEQEEMLVVAPKATALPRFLQKDQCKAQDSDERVCQEGLVNQPKTREQRRTAKAQLVAAMNQGQSWQKAVASVDLPISRATAYRWQRRLHLEGETALDDQRHGHVYKLREPLRRWLVTYCQQAPHTPSHQLQKVLRDQFNVDLSIGYLNEVRAACGVRYVRPRQAKKP